MKTTVHHCAAGFLFTILLASTSVAQAELTRGAAVACIKQYYGITDVAQQEGDSFVQGAAEEPTGQFVNDAALQAGVVYKIRVVTCNESPNANAFFSKKEDNLPPDYTNKNYILYDEQWVSTKLGSGELSFVLGHELAHITNNHDSSRFGEITPVEKELEADFAGGCYVARMKGSASAIESFIKRERARPSPKYPSVEKSLAEALSGYEKCSGAPIPDPNPLHGVEVVYFAKDGDEGRVDSLLQRNHIGFTKRRGEYGSVSDTISCTADVPINQLKLLALLLYDAGIKLKSIQRHANTELSKRLNIESGWSADRSNDFVPLTRDRIENLTDCPDFEGQPLATSIAFQNKCSLADPSLFVRFYDLGRSKWVTAEFNSINYGDEIVLADENGEEYKTDRPFYFYAESSDGITWPTASAVDRRIQLNDGRTVGAQKVRHTVTRNLTCKDLEN